MINCNGAPAELSALAYVEGTLPEAEAERFEEHFFACAVCLAYLQTIQAVGAGMAKLPAPAAVEPKRSSLLSWPTRTWVFGAAAAALLRHPDVFKAASSSSPVTDFRDYDTIYT